MADVYRTETKAPAKKSFIVPFGVEPWRADRSGVLNDLSKMLRRVRGQMGEAHRLPRGNTLHNYGTAARIREVTPEGEVVWDVGFSQGSWLGRTTPIANLYDLL